MPIRRARGKDAATLLALMRPFNAAEGIPFRPTAMGRALRTLLENPEIGFVLLAEAQSRVEGYAVVTFGFDLEWAGRDAFITELFVDPAARRKGVGAALVRRCESEAARAGAAAMHLTVRPENRIARRLYEERGFRRPPRILMTRRLRPRRR